MNEVVLEEPSTLKEAQVEIRLLRQQNEFLQQQLQVAQTFQAKMGLSLDKVTISDLFDKKIMECKGRDLSRARMSSYHYAKLYFLKWCNTRGLDYADEVTVDHTHEFWNWFGKTPGITGKIPGEFNRISMWQSIKATFQYAETRNSIIRNPFKNRVFPISPVKDWWDDEYFYTLIDTIRTNMRPTFRHRYETIVRLIYTTGLRTGLLLGVRNRGVRVDGDRVFITTKRKVQRSSTFQEVTIELLNEKAREMFLTYYDPERPDSYVLISDKATPENARGTFCEVLKGLCERSKIPVKSPHKAKHGYITKMLQKGYTSEQICKLTGNSTPSLINRVYSHLVAGDFVESVRTDIKDL